MNEPFQRLSFGGQDGKAVETAQSLLTRAAPG